MGTRIRLLILGLAVVVAIGGYAWYVKVNRPKADTATAEQTQSFVKQSDLKGSGANTDQEQNVTVDADGTIHLSPVQ